MKFTFKKGGLNTWFKQNNGRGWIDCSKKNKDGSYATCGRKSTTDTKRKYPQCRPTPSDCNDSGKGKKWGKKRAKMNKKENGGKFFFQDGNKVKNLVTRLSSKDASNVLRGLGYSKFTPEYINRNPFETEEKLIEARPDSRLAITRNLEKEGYEAEVTGKYEPSMQYSMVAPGIGMQVPLKNKQQAKAYYDQKEGKQAVSNLLTDLTPGLGDIKAVKELWEEYKTKGTINPLLVASILPIVGSAGDITKTFKPVIKEYGSATEMFTDFLQQAEKQGVKVDRESKLYKQIQDEIPGARNYYKNIDASDEQIGDALYLSTKTEQAQKGLKDSKLKDKLMYHATNFDFDEFRAKKDLIKEGRVAPLFNEEGFFTSPKKSNIGHYGDKIKPLMVSTKNPAIYPKGTTTPQGLEMIGDNLDERIVDFLKQNKYDSFGVGTLDNIDEFASFEPTQLKSLFRKHLGKWNWSDSNIHRAVGAGIGLGITNNVMNKNNQQKKEGGKFYFQDGNTVDNGILNWKKRLSESTIPREFTNVSSSYIWNNYLKPFIKGKSEEGKLTKENIEKIYGKDNVDPQIDMLRVMLGLPQHHNMLVESEVKTDKDKTGRQFDFGPEYKTKMINDLKRAYKSFDGLIKVHNLTYTEEEVFDHKLVDFHKSLQGGNPQGRVYTGEATTLYPMGIHQESMKVDPVTKKRYIEYRDVFDFTPEQVKGTVFENASAIVADPYTVYGRIYEDEFEDPTIIKNRYSKPLLNEGTKYKQLQMKRKQGGKFYFKTGNKLNTLNTTTYKEYQKGGIITGGVLHSENNNIGDKGIPVVPLSSFKKGGKYDKKLKVAEIEKNEIIFVKSISNKIDNLVDEYNDCGCSGKLVLLGELIYSALKDTSDETCRVQCEFKPKLDKLK